MFLKKCPDTFKMLRICFLLLIFVAIVSTRAHKGKPGGKSGGIPGKNQAKKNEGTEKQCNECFCYLGDGM